MWHRKQNSKSSDDLKNKEPSSSSQSHSTAAPSLPHVEIHNLIIASPAPLVSTPIPLAPPLPTSRPTLASLANIDRKEPGTSSANLAPAARRPLPPSGTRHQVASTSNTAMFPVSSGNRAPASRPPASLAHIDRTNPIKSKPTPQQPPHQPGTHLPTNPQSSSHGPPKTTYTNPHDVKMASIHTQYHTLAPSLQKEQDEWAAQKFRENMPPCPMGFRWVREKKGYKCEGGSHFVSDELLIEGKGGWYQLFYDNTWKGPMYEVEKEDEKEEAVGSTESEKGNGKAKGKGFRSWMRG